MIVLDASVLIAFLDGTDAHHRAAEDLLAVAVDDELGVNPLTLAEVLVRPARTGRLDTVLTVLADLAVEVLAFPPDTPVRLARIRASTGLKMPDCCVLLSADDAAAGIATLDGRLAEAAQLRGLRVLRF